MPATVFASAGGRKYHFKENCTALESARSLNDWECEEFCSHLHPLPRALKRKSSTKAAMEGKLPCLACVPSHLREIPETDGFGHQPIEIDGDRFCARCKDHGVDPYGDPWTYPTLWPCTSAVVLGLAPRPCPYCKGNGGDPNDEGDYIPEVGRYNPYSVAPCPECHGTGQAASAVR